MPRHVRRRLAAGLVSTALVGGGIALGAATPAQASTSGGTATYACQTILGLPAGTVTVIPGLPTPGTDGTATVPVTMTLDGLVAATDALTGVIDTLDAALGGAVPLDLVTGGATSGVQTLTGTLTETIPAQGDSLPVPLPDTLDFGTIPGLDAVCDLLAPLNDLPLPGLPGGETGGDTGGSTGGSTTTTHPTSPTTTHPTTSTHVTKRRTPNLRAKAVKRRVHHRAHPRVRVTVRSAGKPVAGRIVIRFRDRVIGHGRLHKGKLVLSLKRLARGKRTVTVVFPKTENFTRTTKKVTFRIVK